MSFPWKKLFLREAVSWFDNEAVIWSCFGSFATSVLCRGKGTSWMGSFLNACQNCRIDAIAIHSYWCTLESWMKMKVSYKKLIAVKIGLLPSFLTSSVSSIFSDSFNRTVVSDTVNIGEFSFCRFGQDGIQNLVGNYRRFGKKIWLTECHGWFRNRPDMAQRSSGFPCKHGLYSKLLHFSGNPANHPKMLKAYGSTIPMNRCRGLSHQQ